MAKVVEGLNVSVDVDTTSLEQALAMVQELNDGLEEYEQRLHRVAALGEDIRRKERLATL